MATRVYLGLGSNLGDREANLLAAIEGLEPAVTVTAQSSIYQTEAWGVDDQPDFLNMALAGMTALEPAALLHFVKRLEVALGREPAERWGPRVIDIDILFFGNEEVDLPGLQVPHVGAHERATVLVPLAEIAPDLMHPGSGTTVASLVDGVDKSGVRPYHR